MGALTDSRKRITADHRLPIPSFPPPSPPPASKRPKLAQLPSSLDPSTSASPPPNPSPQIIHAAAAAASTSTTPVPSSSCNPASSPLPNRRRLPPPPPFKRPIHGPQRVLCAFRFDGPARPHAAGPSWSSPSSPPPPQPRSLGLEQYVELVNSVSHPAPPTPTAIPDAVREKEAVPLEVVAVEEDGDDRKQQDDEEEVVRGCVVVRRGPLYKELYEASSRKRDAKLKTLEFEVRLAEEGRLGLERLAEVLPRISPKEEEVPEPFVPLTDEDEEIVREALHGRNSRERLAVHEPSNIVITREILQCLNNQEWLNDELISGGYDYKAVRRWTTKRKLGYSLIECDKIFVPIHKEVHWCLAVINIKDKKFQYLDSLGSMDMKVLRILARYFVDEVKDKSGQHIDALSWKQEGVKNLPLQENGWDCGMFMLKYIDFYSGNMDLIFGQKHMRYFRKRTAKEILNLRAE
ncbi:ubiquitin-like-specific protease ESD4 isoform X3 [Panicum virgatum]|uniref:ubiquitin-like-specific protease ESD4 isoform X3 n=1 Tax=Panicum virgatum TaxID=38727 RepID=UPI0019D544F8|nr:ubiquitin-like-specific protease ESD4 isoform X3 [Panicum virgatum]